MTQLFIRIAGSKDWGSNQAGSGIAAGTRAQVLLADGGALLLPGHSRGSGNLRFLASAVSA